jgi:hypothetical protein
MTRASGALDAREGLGTDTHAGGENRTEAPPCGRGGPFKTKWGVPNQSCYPMIGQ